MAMGRSESSGVRTRGPGGVLRRDNLALIYQEALTAVVRLRSNRQAVSDAASFRAHMRQLLSTAEQEARTQGYTGEDARLATFAVVAFLDESVLNLRNPVLADWPRKPLQEELFGGHVAGEVLFQSLQRLMEQADSPELADVLEVFHLSLLLGYRGKYGMGGQADLQALMRTIAERIQRIRKASGRFSPAWAPPAGPVMAQRDPWLKRLTIGAIACLALALVLLVSFSISLSYGVSDLNAVVLETSRVKPPAPQGR